MRGESHTSRALSGGHVVCYISCVRVRASTVAQIAVRQGEDGDQAVTHYWSPALNLTHENANDAPTTPFAPEQPLLDHERLDCYRVSLEFAVMVPALAHPARAPLRDQLERAAASICLNIAEGCGRRTRRDRLHFFSIAQGSAMECAAAIDLLRVNGHVTFADAIRAKHKLTRIVQMLSGLRRS